MMEISMSKKKRSGMRDEELNFLFCRKRFLQSQKKIKSNMKSMG